eukprot:10701_1
MHHIRVGRRCIDIPSLVRKDSERHVDYALTSPLEQLVQNRVSKSMHYTRASLKRRATFALAVVGAQGVRETSTMRSPRRSHRRVLRGAPSLRDLLRDRHSRGGQEVDFSEKISAEKRAKYAEGFTR